MNKDQKAAVVDRVAGEIEASDAIIAVDYRGLSVKQAKDLRTALNAPAASRLHLPRAYATPPGVSGFVF